MVKTNLAAFNSGDLSLMESALNRSELFWVLETKGGKKSLQVIEHQEIVPPRRRIEPKKGREWAARLVRARHLLARIEYV